MHPVEDVDGRWHAQAPAKINLALHITGRRADGYHLLDTLAVFTALGDRITVTPAAEDRLTISGPMAGSLDPAQDNLVTRARDRLRAGHAFGPVAIHLEKILPVSSGIGGGSSDAAATLRALNACFDLGLSSDALAATGLALGADLPMCVCAAPLRAEGIGEDIAPVLPFPALAMVLVNPGVAVSTPEVFRHLASRDNAPLPGTGTFTTVDSVIGWLDKTRNDMQAAACAICPAITAVLAALAAEKPRLARMSGSGATCFAIFSSSGEADAAARRLSAAHPAWFVAATTSFAAQTGDAP